MPPQAEETISEERVTSLARTAVKQYGPHSLPPSISREDLEQTAAAEILTQAQRAWENGKPTEAQTLLKAAKRKVHKEVTSQGGGEVPLREEDGAQGDEDTPSERKSLLEDLLEVLPQWEKDLVVYRYMGSQDSPGGKTITQVAHHFDIARSTAHDTLERALQAMSEAAHDT